MVNSPARSGTSRQTCSTALTRYFWTSGELVQSVAVPASQGLVASMPFSSGREAKKASGWAAGSFT